MKNFSLRLFNIVNAGITLLIFSALNSVAQTNIQKFLYLKRPTQSNISPGTKYDANGNLFLVTVNASVATLTKFDPNLNVMWAKNYTNFRLIRDFIFCADNSIVLSGYYTPPSPAPGGPSIVKMDYNGNTLMSKIVYDSLYTAYSGDVNPQIKPTPDSGFIFIDCIDSIFPNTQAHLRIIKFDKNGTIEWRKIYNNSGITGAFGYSFIVVTDSGYIIEYLFNDQRLTVIKLDLNGNFIWGKGRNIPGNISMEAREIIPLNDGNFLMSCTYYPASFSSLLIKMDVNGNFLWSKGYAPHISAVNGLKQLSNGNYLVQIAWDVGLHYASYLMEVDTAGSINWARTVSHKDSLLNYSEDRFISLDVSATGKIVYLSKFENYNTYDLLLTQTDLSFNNLCIVKDTIFTPSNFLFSQPDVLTDETFNSNTSIQLLNFPVADSIFTPLDSIACSPLGVVEYFNETNLEISPNPFNEQLSIRKNTNGLSEIILYDISSRKLLQQKFTNSVTLNASQLAKGIYIYEVRNKNGVIKKGKVVKE